MIMIKIMMVIIIILTAPCSETERKRCKNGASCVVDVSLNTTSTSCVCLPGFTDPDCATG